MKEEYKVRFYINNTYEVFKITTKYGERTSAYDSEPDDIEEESVFQGYLADCEAYIRLHEGGYM
jgi:hypothetical protein